jgi:hypothetical protein
MIRKRIKHIKRGTTYQIVGRASIQISTSIKDGDVVYVYESEDDGKWYVRPITEFTLDRFEDLLEPMYKLDDEE